MSDAAASAPAVASRPGTVRPRPWLAIGACAVVAAGLLVLAVPRTLAAWDSLNGDEVYRALAAGKTPSNREIALAVEGLERAIDRVPSGQRYYMLASAEYERFRRAGTNGTERMNALNRVEQVAAQALAASPSDGRAAIMLASARVWLGRPPRDVAVPLLQSLDTNPGLRELWAWRATLLFAVWPALAPDEIQVVNSQLRTVWALAPHLRRPLLEAARQTGREAELTRALADEPDAVVELEQLKAAATAQPRR